MKNLRRAGLAAALAILAVSCMSQEDFNAIDGAVSRFREQQAAKNDAQAYRETDDLFRKETSMENFARLNEAVRRAAGECQAPETKPSGWNINQSTSGHFITVSYQRVCTSGPLTETFTFKMAGQTPKLAGYNISGMALFPAAPPPAPAATPPNTLPHDDASPKITPQPT